MKSLVNNKWQEGFLDYYKSPNEYRLQVLAFKNLEKLENVYFVRQKSLKTLYNYTKKFGFKAVARKAISRLKESLRNEKYISCGIGKIIETDLKQKFKTNQTVAFLAPFTPALVERIVLPEELIFPIDFNTSFLKEKSILYLESPSAQEWYQQIKAWTIYSGKDLKSFDLGYISQKTTQEIKNSSWQSAKNFPASQSNIQEFKGTLPNNSKNNAVVFGWGHYAKTNIFPNIKPLKIVSVHEIDPFQIAPFKKSQINYWDTAPLPRDTEKEKYNTYFIASFHHTHTPLAITAFKQNANAVVEKPITTTKKQLEDLLAALKNSKGQLFSAFHKRYSPLNKFIFKDLKNSETTPINYHAIVYEVPLPNFHWYRWPNSQSSLVTNGCHWIDQFLFLNNFSKPKKYGVSLSSDKSTINAWAELENGAFFTMALTDKGSEYIGVRDYVELRTKNKTAKIIDDSIYIAEDKSGIVRKKKINKMKNYKTMYKTIAKKITTGQKGDSLKSLEVSSGLILELEEKLKSMI